MAWSGWDTKLRKSLPYAKFFFSLANDIFIICSLKVIKSKRNINHNMNFDKQKKCQKGGGVGQDEKWSHFKCFGVTLPLVLQWLREAPTRKKEQNFGFLLNWHDRPTGIFGPVQFFFVPSLFLVSKPPPPTLHWTNVHT